MALDLRYPAINGHDSGNVMPFTTIINSTTSHRTGNYLSASSRTVAGKVASRGNGTYPSASLGSVPASKTTVSKTITINGMQKKGLLRAVLETLAAVAVPILQVTALAMLGGILIIVYNLMPGGDGAGVAPELLELQPRRRPQAWSPASGVSAVQSQQPTAPASSVELVTLTPHLRQFGHDLNHDTEVPLQYFPFNRALDSSDILMGDDGDSDVDMQELVSASESEAEDGDSSDSEDEDSVLHFIINGPLTTLKAPRKATAGAIGRSGGTRAESIAPPGPDRYAPTGRPGSSSDPTPWATHTPVVPPSTYGTARRPGPDAGGPDRLSSHGPVLDDTGPLADWQTVPSPQSMELEAEDLAPTQWPNLDSHARRPAAGQFGYGIIVPAGQSHHGIIMPTRGEDRGRPLHSLHDLVLTQEASSRYGGHNDLCSICQTHFREG